MAHGGTPCWGVPWVLVLWLLLGAWMSALREVELHPPLPVLHLPLLSVVWVCTLPGADHVPCLRAHTPAIRTSESQGPSPFSGWSARFPCRSAPCLWLHSPAGPDPLVAVSLTCFFCLLSGWFSSLTCGSSDAMAALVRFGSPCIASLAALLTRRQTFSPTVA